MKERREKEEERKQDRICTPRGAGAKAEERFLHPRKPPHQWGNQLGQKGEYLRLLEEGETAGLWQTGQSETYTDGPCHSPVCPRLGCVSTIHGG